jgi:guanylate kinase
MMFVLSSPSGAGKTTLTKKLLKNNSNFALSISYTTRKPRPNEINGKDYFFINKYEFEELTKKENFFEHAKIFNNFYGTRKEPVLKFLSEGKDVLFDIDWQGTQQLKKIKNLLLVTFFILPPNIKILKDRLLNRHEGEEKIILDRMNKFNEEVSHWDEYNYVVINDNLEICYNKIIKIITSEKCKVKEKQDQNEIKNKINELIK